MRNDALAIHIDGTPITGLGWNDICAQQNGPDVLTMNAPDHVDPLGRTAVVGSNFNLARVLVLVGRDVYKVCPAIPYDQLLTQGASGPYDIVENPTIFTQHTSWNGDTQFDWTILRYELRRRFQQNPQVKVILQVMLDGGLEWEKAHGELMTSTPFLIDLANQFYDLIPHPDYGHSYWKSSAEWALQNLVSEINGNADLNSMVIGYQLMNGPSLDTNFRMDPTGPSGFSRFQAYLRNVKYASNPANLRAAWNISDSNFGFDQALPLLAGDPSWKSLAQSYAPLLVNANSGSPNLYQRRADTREFVAWAEEDVVRHFAQTIKNLTNRRAIVGARFGEALDGRWRILKLDEKFAADHAMVHQRTKALYNDPNIDFFEIWESYGPARYFGKYGGSGVPLLPTQALQASSKLYIVENDFRTHDAGDTNEGVGGPGNLGFLGTLAKQRRVFVNALVNGLGEYLWQMQGSNFGSEALRYEWKKHEDIYRRSLSASRKSVAEIAYVIDPEIGKYFIDSFDPIPLPSSKPRYDQPTMAQYLIQFPMNAWARTGAPFDTVSLDQILDPSSGLRSYKVYIFYHTLGLSTANMDRIRQLMSQNHAVAIFIWADGMMNEKGQLASASNIAAKISYLTGFTVSGSANSRSAKLVPHSNFTTAGGVVTDLERWQYPTGISGSAGDMWLFPSFTISCRTDAASGESILATHSDGRTPAIVKKQMPGWGSIYSASPYLAPDLIRYALKWAGGTLTVTNTSEVDDVLYLNQSFLGFHTRVNGKENSLTGARDILLRLPVASYPKTNKLHSVLVDLDSEMDGRISWGTDGYMTTDSSGNPVDPTEIGATTCDASNCTYKISVKPNRTYLYFRGSSSEWAALPK